MNPRCGCDILQAHAYHRYRKHCTTKDKCSAYPKAVTGAPIPKTDLLLAVVIAYERAFKSIISSEPVAAPQRADCSAPCISTIQIIVTEP
jgi:hypothetical protein